MEIYFLPLVVVVIFVVPDAAIGVVAVVRTVPGSDAVTFSSGGTGAIVEEEEDEA